MQEKQFIEEKYRARKNELELKEMQNKTEQNKKNQSKKLPKAKGDFFKNFIIGFIIALLKKIFGRSKAPQTVQESIPYETMYPDGICKVDKKLYTKTIAFQDINYQLAQNDDKSQIFESWCDFLNYFDSSVRLQFTFINQYGNLQDFKRSIHIPSQSDGHDGSRKEFSDMLKNQLSKGNNGLVKTKYVTFGIESDNLKAAKTRLERIETDILNNFKIVGVAAQSLNGKERLEILHGQLNNGGKEKFHFDWKTLAKSGLSTKDFIAPSSFTFQNGRFFRMGKICGATSFVQIIAPELPDSFLAEILDIDSSITVNMHIQSIDQMSAIKNIKRKLSDIGKSKIEEQQKAMRSGYDTDLISTDLLNYGEDAKNLLEDLQSRNERMFLVTIIVLNTAETMQKLENSIFAAASVAQKHNCSLKRLDYQQEQALMSSLALGINQIEIQRGLTTSSTGVFVPFTTQELFQEGEAFYYGLNALSNNLIMANRKNLKNPNGLYNKGSIWDWENKLKVFQKRLPKTPSEIPIYRGDSFG